MQTKLLGCDGLDSMMMEPQWSITQAPSQCELKQVSIRMKQAIWQVLKYMKACLDTSEWIQCAKS